jgi:hypothetical protein
MLFEAVLCIVKLNHSTNFRPLLFFTWLSSDELENKW